MQLFSNEKYQSQINVSKLVRIPISGYIKQGKNNIGMLIEPAAKMFIQMRDAAAKDGFYIGLTDSYRSYQQQVNLSKQDKCTDGVVACATPGSSVHGWGRAVDLNDNGKGIGWHSGLYAWLTTNAHKYKWKNPDWARSSEFGGHAKGKSLEPWHWEYVGDGVQPNPAIDETLPKNGTIAKSSSVKNNDFGSKAQSDSLGATNQKKEEMFSLAATYSELDINSASKMTKAELDGKVVEKKTKETESANIRVEMRADNKDKAKIG